MQEKNFNNVELGEIPVMSVALLPRYEFCSSHLGTNVR